MATSKSAKIMAEMEKVKAKISDQQARLPRWEKDQTKHAELDGIPIKHGGRSDIRQNCSNNKHRQC